MQMNIYKIYTKSRVAQTMSQESMQQKAERGEILRMTAEVVAAYVGNNSLQRRNSPT